MDYQFIKVEKEGPVTTITLNRPEVMNAISPEMHEELQRAFDSYAADLTQYVCVITGAGERAFCAGSDLKAPRVMQYPENGYAGLIERFDLPKPIIAAVNGLALGGGFEIALACDLVISTESASFGLVEPLVGAVALAGGIHRLARQIGLKQAMALVLTSRRISAEEAARLGFVNEVVPAGRLKAVTAQWCEEILRGAPLAIRASKEAIMRGLDEPSLEQAICNQAKYPAFSAWTVSEDIDEGVLAFNEKRKPVWRGR